MTPGSLLVADTDNLYIRYMTCGGTPSPTPADLYKSLTASPTRRPTSSPIGNPTNSPTVVPSAPTLGPSTTPTRAPPVPATLTPTTTTSPPSKSPSTSPTLSPTTSPTRAPSLQPTSPTLAPTISSACYAFPPPPYQTLFNAAVVPGAEQTDSGNQVVVGLQVNFSVPGTITAIRYFRPQNEAIGNHWGKIWDSASQTLLTKVFFDETQCGAEAWFRQVLPTPLAVTASTVYMVGIDYLIYYPSIDGGTADRLTNGYVGTPGRRKLLPSLPRHLHGYPTPRPQKPVLGHRLGLGLGPG